MNYLIKMERCRHCQFDLCRAAALVAGDSLVQRQQTLIRKLESAENGTDATATDRFAVLRHIVTLIVGQNLGLEYFRRVVADWSGLSRVDVPLPYEPDAEILHFEELSLLSRASALEAAVWLTEEWPTRFVDCARTAKVAYPALNRNAISVPWFNEVIMAGYGYAWHDIDLPTYEMQLAAKKAPEREPTEIPDKTGTGGA